MNLHFSDHAIFKYIKTVRKNYSHNQNALFRTGGTSTTEEVCWLLH